MSRSLSTRCSQARMASIFDSTNRARLRFSLGISGGWLVRKVIKDTKGASRPANQSRLNQILLTQAKSQVGTTHAGVLWEADAGVRQKAARLNLSNRFLDQRSELLALLLRDRGAQVLNFDQALAHEHHFGYLSNARNPGIANQLRIERQQPLGFFRVTARG